MTRRLDALDLDGVIQVDKIPSAGREVTIKATAEQCEALAERFKVSKVEEFSASVLASRFRGGIQAKGRVEGRVVQPCVVTGDPVEQSISEPVDRVFLPGHDEASQSSAGAEVFVNLEDDDLPDYFEGNDIDIAELALEVFAMAIDLYPRKPGAALEAGIAGDDPAELSPFAALKALKKD